MTGTPEPPERFLVSGVMRPDKVKEIPWAKSVIENAPSGSMFNDHETTQAYTDYFLRLMWLQESWVLDRKENYRPSESNLAAYFRGAYLLATGEMIPDYLVNHNCRDSVIQSMRETGLIQQEQDEVFWKLYYYRLTLERIKNERGVI